VPVLPTEPVTATDRAVHARPGDDGNPLERGKRVVGNDEQRASGGRFASIGDDGKGSARLQRRLDEVVAVTVLAFDRDEGFAGADRAAVNRYA